MGHLRFADAKKLYLGNGFAAEQCRQVITHISNWKEYVAGKNTLRLVFAAAAATRVLPLRVGVSRQAFSWRPQGDPRMYLQQLAASKIAW